MTFLAWDEFQRVDLRLGTSTNVEAFPQAHKPTFKLQIDLGDLG